MSFSRPVVRSLAALIAVSAVLGACSDRSTRPQALTPAEVGGEYLVCALTFQPNQTLLPGVDVRAVATDTTSNRVAQLNVDNLSLAAELEYYPPGGTLRRRHAATYQPASRTIVLGFTTPAPLMSELFLPASLELDFEAESNRLSFLRTNQGVPRESYATYADVSPEGLADTIRGTLAGEFQVAGCP
jgi:hypothetical protein